MANSDNPSWTLKRALEFYNILVWGEGYFGVNDQGHMIAKPDEFTSIDLVKVSKEIRARELSLPVLVRFPQILQARVKELNNAFIRAAKNSGCQLTHIPYYPIKVNQQRTVIEKILSSDVEKIGLEVGSKTELLVALGLLDTSQARLICNGYKDRAYIRIALSAQLMGIEVFIVIENLSELEIIKQESQTMNVKPKLGMRIRMNSVASGNWQNSGGRDAKFGLDSRDILLCLSQLKQWGCSEWLYLVHFHMGSQISNLEEFSVGLREAMQLYSQVISRGFKPGYIDVGGGLAVDYAAMNDTSHFSKAYSIQDYANTVVNTVNNFCLKAKITLPTVITENGRALTAHHAMLITNVLEVESHNYLEQSASDINKGHQELHELGNKLIEHLNGDGIIESQQAEAFETLLNEKFLSGEVDLEQRAWAEAILRRCSITPHLSGVNQNIDGSGGIDKYYCNFSIFQSMPDVWGLDQIFPIMPLMKLNQQPSVKTRLHDLTCDSDGQVSHYAMDGKVQDHLLLHELNDHHKKYLLGFFLLGAYQEVLGDMHNLFGDTHAVNVEQDEQGQLAFSEIEVGDCVDEMLNSIHLQGQQIIDRCQQRISQMGTSSVPTGGMIDEINKALFGYTYLDSIDRPAHRIKR
jgi:arginine decarboxylase